MRSLLDVNVLIALAFPNHELHNRAHNWMRKDPARKWATCPLTQGRFLRIASRMAGNSRASAQLALAALEQNCASPNHAYWSDCPDLLRLPNSIRARITGHNQIADLQLLWTAHEHSGQLVTFDSGLRELASSTPLAESLLIL